MKLHQLKSFGKRKKNRVGRGGKRGTYSGRGLKGQKSRAGRRIRPAERDLILRLPKKRGFRNKPKSPKPLVFNLGFLNDKLKARANGKELKINPQLLKEAGLVPLKYRGEIKILGDGQVDFPVSFEGVKVSKSAKAKAEKAGGVIKT